MGAVAGFGLCQSCREPVAQPRDANHAGFCAGQCAGRGVDAPYPQCNAGGVERRLCSHRPRQGVERGTGGIASRAAQCAGTRNHAWRARIRRAAIGGGADRAGIYNTRLRQADRRCGLQPRLCGRAGSRAMHGARLYPAQPCCRFCLCASQSEAARMTANSLDAVSVDAGERPWLIALRRLIRRPGALIGLAVVIFFVVLALVSPLVSPYDPLATDWRAVRKPPSALHFFGTDDLGRDVLARLIWGARASLMAGLVSVSIALAVAVPLGLVSGYLGGVVDGLVMRIIDAMLAIPFLVLAIALAAFLGPSLTNAMIAIGVVQVPIFTRLTRGQALAVKHEDYIEAARAVGNPHRRILVRHILPNILAPILVQATLAVAAAIIAEASLSFLGLGQQPPAPSWGSMLNTASHFLSQAPWMALWPGLAIFTLVLSFNLLGDGLRDALDPRRG